MVIKSDVESCRKSKLIHLNVDFVIAGGGMAGTCAAITAAREGLKVVLVQDRPVLGGNASSEVRLWILGASSHMGNNNRWAREGGVIDEILIENLYRNKEGNPIILDTVLLEKITNEPNITLLLNTSVYEIHKKEDRNIDYLKAFCSQNSTEYELHAPLFCDASGDGIVGFLAGAAFRMGAENKQEFGELLAPDEAFGELLGHSMYFYSKRADKPVKYTPPAFALKDIKKIPKYKILNPKDDGCRLWWIEYGGRTDTVHDTEHIKWELWRVIYGIWDYIKNSGKFEDVEDLTLEWVGTIPGKRESRRFEGHYILKQQDVVEQKEFEDAVSFGGWALDIHPADGIYSELPSCTQWHSKGVYQIPYRSFVSKDIDNLFFAGRIISATHVAFGSTRVMATCAHGGQAVGMAAVLCIQNEIKPKNILEKDLIKNLQYALNKTGQSITGIPIKNNNNISNSAIVKASSTLLMDEIPPSGEWLTLNESAGQILPFRKGNIHRFTVFVKSKEKTTLIADLRISSKKANYTPDITLEKIEVSIEPGEQQITLDFKQPIPEDQYGFLIFQKNKDTLLRSSNNRYTGILSFFNGKNKAVSNHGKQSPPAGIGIEEFEFWCPRRRPAGQNIAMKISPAIEAYEPDNIMNGFSRPYLGTNAWAADLKDLDPQILLEWKEKKQISRVTLFLDTDFDHPLESSLLGHLEDVIPFCVHEYEILDDTDKVIYDMKNNHQTINKIDFDHPINTSQLKIRCKHPDTHIPAAIFEIIVE